MTDERGMRANTFSIVACDPVAEELGVAISSKILAVGAFCPFVRGGVGALASQAYLNPYLGYDGLQKLAEGLVPSEVVERLLASDPGREWRQVAIVDAAGRSAAFSGSRTDAWSGDRVGSGYAVAGNLLISGDTISAMADSFEASRDLSLVERLLRSLEAGQEAGGDRRGRQSAALVVGKRLELPYIDLRVDDHHEPVEELRRLLTLAPETMIPLGERISTTREPRGPEELSLRQQAIREQLGQP